MEPYWHPVRSEQVIGRARRICSHKDLPKALQTVEVFVYLMIFSESQLKSDEAIELKRKDLSKAIPRFPITSDQYLFEISEIKANLTGQLTDAVKESAFDCYIYSNGKCVNFGDPTNDKYAYVPDYAEQQNDTTVKANKVAVEWVGKPITINGVEYVYRRSSKDVLDLYDKETYTRALEDSSIQPLKVGTYEINERGEKVLKLIT
jgi:predicted nucleic acid-binding protein